MNSKPQNILFILLAALLIGGFSIANLAIPDKKYSTTERRTLASNPDLTYNSITSGKYMKEFETYAQDQFPLRNKFRSLKANTRFRIFKQLDDKGLYCHNGSLSKLEYPLNETLLKNAGDKFTDIYETYLSESNCNSYLAIIPDKNYFLAPSGGYPHMDYEKAVSLVRGQTEFAEYIDIFPTLSTENYYLTDQHWKQETLFQTAETLLYGMQKDNDAFSGIDSSQFSEQVLEKPFYGAYYDQLALKVSPDELHYLTSPVTEQCTVTSYNTGMPVTAPFYDMEKANGRDPYEMFLNGSDALLTIDNPAASTDRELILFRDSFASSITPLLVSEYKKITLIDLRYIKSDYIGAFVEFTNQDVLFLYSTLLLNHSTGLQ